MERKSVLVAAATLAMLLVGLRSAVAPVEVPGPSEDPAVHGDLDADVEVQTDVPEMPRNASASAAAVAEYVCDASKLLFPLIGVDVMLSQKWLLPEDENAAGWKMFAHSPNRDEYISASLVTERGNQMFELHEKHVLYHTIRAIGTDRPRPTHPIYVDVGANIGLHALFFAALDIETHAFEPIKTNFAMLQCSVAANKNMWEHVKLYNVGLSNVKVDEACMEVDTSNQGHAFLSQASFACAQLVTLRTLDDHWRDTLQRRRIYLVKIDVEGFEPRVFEGATEMLREAPPPFIFMEWTPGKSRGYGVDTIAFLKSTLALGYRITRLLDGVEIVDTPDSLEAVQDKLWNLKLEHVETIAKLTRGELVL